MIKWARSAIVGFSRRRVQCPRRFLRDIVALQENRHLLFDEFTQEAGVLLPKPLGSLAGKIVPMGKWQGLCLAIRWGCFCGISWEDVFSDFGAIRLG